MRAISKGDFLTGWWDRSVVAPGIFYSWMKCSFLICPITSSFKAHHIFHTLERWSVSSFHGGQYCSISWSSWFIFWSCQSASFWCSSQGCGCCKICLGSILGWLASSSSFRVCSWGHINHQFQTSNQTLCSANHCLPIITSCCPRLRIRKDWFRNCCPPTIKWSLMVCVICGPSELLNPLVFAGCFNGSIGML